MRSRPFAQQCITDLIEKELADLYKLVYNSNKMMKEHEVTKVRIEKLTTDMQATAPILWKLLETIAHSKSQEKRNTRKRPEKVRVSRFGGFL